MARERVHETGRNGSTVAHVVEELCTRDHGIDILAKITQARRQLPSQTLVIDAFEHIRSALFPGYFGITELTPDNLRYHVGADLDYAAKVLRDQVRRGLCYECGNLDGDCPTCPDRADRISQ
jgi:serine O-acetyltransferase